ncbi:MAG: TRAP transporter small permease [Pikeienuella sp.]
MTSIRHVCDGLVAISRLLARIELLACRVLIVGFAGLLLVNVTLRYTMAAPLYFAEELAVYILIWMAFLAIAATIARQEMIALTFAVDNAPPWVRHGARIIVELIVLGLVAVLAVVSWRWLNGPAMQFEQALTLGMKKQPFYAIIPLFFFLATLHTAANLLCHLGLASRDKATDEPGGEVGV